jgi:farnesyl diphosphate synthase
MSFAQRLAAAAAAVEARLLAAIDVLPESELRAAMAYAVAGGKGFRGLLVLESAALHGVARDHALNAAAAIEAMHSFSLIHDDLPAMDDDDLRRGRPTVHVAWSEAVAILAGDALQSLAFELLAQPGQPRPGEMVRSLARAAGAGGMAYGQMLDIAVGKAPVPPDLDAIGRLQAAKTGALIGWSATAGPRMAGAACEPLDNYAAALGLAFQIADDILDCEGDAGRLGKRVQKDEAAGKATFVSHLGLQGARARAEALAEDACAALAPYGAQADILCQAARFVVSRDR